MGPSKCAQKIPYSLSTNLVFSPRSCVGQRFAKLELYLMAAKVDAFLEQCNSIKKNPPCSIKTGLPQLSGGPKIQNGAFGRGGKAKKG